MTAADKSALEAYRDHASRRRKIALGPTQILRMLQLPETATVLHVYAETDPSRICVVIADPQFTRVPEDAQAPYLHNIVTSFEDGRMTLVYHDGDTGEVT